MRIITVGRDAGNNVVVRDPKVSNRHLQLKQDDSGRCSIVDLNSSNGTYVNGRRIQGEVPLRPGDQVRIGNTILPWMQYFQNIREGGMSAWMIVLIVVGGLVGLVVTVVIALSLLRMDRPSGAAIRHDKDLQLVDVPQPRDIMVAPGQTLEDAFSAYYPSESMDKSRNIGGAKFLAEQAADKQNVTFSRNYTNRSVQVHVCPLHEMYLVPDCNPQSAVAMIRKNEIEITSVEVHSIEHTSMVVRNLTQQTLTILIPQGLIFEIVDNGEQNLVVSEEVLITLSAYESQSISLSTYCAAHHRSSPSGPARVTPYVLYAPASIYQSQSSVWQYIESRSTHRVVFYAGSGGTCINVPSVGYVGYTERSSSMMHVSTYSEITTSSVDSCVVYLNDYQYRCIQQKVESLQQVSRSFFSRYDGTEFMIDVAEAGGIYYGQSTSFSSSMQFVRELKSYSEHR